MAVDAPSPDEEYTFSVAKARLIFHATGRAIDPWDVDLYPADWFEAIRQVLIEEPAARKALNKGT